MNNIIKFELLPGEIELKKIESTSVSIGAFLTHKKLFAQDVVITDKRVALVTNSMPGWFNSPISMFYKGEDAKLSGNALSMKNVTKKDGDVILEAKKGFIVGQKWRLKDEGILDLVSKYLN